MLYAVELSFCTNYIFSSPYWSQPHFLVTHSDTYTILCLWLYRTSLMPSSRERFFRSLRSNRMRSTRRTAVVSPRTTRRNNTATAGSQDRTKAATRTRTLSPPSTTVMRRILVPRMAMISTRLRRLRLIRVMPSFSPSSCPQHPRRRRTSPI